MNDIEMFMLECIDKLQDIEWLNNGGCGIAALSIYRALKMRYPDAPDTFIFLGSGGLDEAPAHVVYVWEHLVADTASTIWDDDTEFLIKTPYNRWGETEYVSGDVLLSVLKDPENWNPTFEREVEVPKIEDMLGISLADIPQS